MSPFTKIGQKWVNDQLCVRCSSASLGRVKAGFSKVEMGIGGIEHLGFAEALDALMRRKENANSFRMQLS